jgi:16S rRNA (cytosine1402-N4)-methyltransferase
MLDEVVEQLSPIDGGIFVDGTFGAGGYSSALLDRGARTVIAIDRDPTAIAGGEKLAQASGGRLKLVEGRFGTLDEHASGQGFASVDGVVLDVGVSSMQLDQADRGFSFRTDGPLDMRMERAGLSAADVLNSYEAGELTRIIGILGEEKRAGSVARAIVARRAEVPFATTADLVSVIERVLGPKRFGQIHPATRTFQAVRIFVNRELDELGHALAAAERCLKEGGRLVVVAFHSLEDRIVKRFLADRSRITAGGSRHQPEATVEPATFTLAARGAFEPSEAEVARNPRARSARLRAAVRTAAPSRSVDFAALGVPRLAPVTSQGMSR